MLAWRIPRLHGGKCSMKCHRTLTMTANMMLQLKRVQLKSRRVYVILCFTEDTRRGRVLYSSVGSQTVSRKVLMYLWRGHRNSTLQRLLRALPSSCIILRLEKGRLQAFHFQNPCAVAQVREARARPSCDINGFLGINNPPRVFACPHSRGRPRNTIEQEVWCTKIRLQRGTYWDSILVRLILRLIVLRGRMYCKGAQPFRSIMIVVVQVLMKRKYSYRAYP